MHFILKSALIIAFSVLIVSTAYTYVFNSQDKNDYESQNTNEYEEDEYLENENEDEYVDDVNDIENGIDINKNSDKDFTHYVFVEAGTTVCCKACANVHFYLDEYFESNRYPFYYISMPVENSKAADYLDNYNIYGYPTVYFDGGYEVIFGATDWKPTFEEKMSSAISRNVPKILVNITGEYKENDNEIKINLFLENYELSNYSGRLKVYLTEIISTRWQGDQPYKYAFIDLALDKEIQIPSIGNISISKTIDSTDLDPENLMVFAVVYNSISQDGYSLPPDQKTFDAFYADAATATKIIESGNLPPMVGISSPTIGYVHRFGAAKRASTFGRTILLGKSTIVANVSDDSAIEKVEFYIDDTLMETVTEEPYEWKWHKLTIGGKTITVIAYDEEGKTSSAEIDVVAFIKWKNPIMRLLGI